MMHLGIALLLALAVTTAPATRPTSAPTRPASQPSRRMTNVEAVEQRFAARVSKAGRAFEDEARAAREERSQGLEQVVEYAMDRRDLDLAIRARESIAAGDAAATQPAEARLPPKAVESRDDLRKALAGTRWTWGNDRLQLMADGDVQMAEWTARGLVTRWRAVDRRTVLFVIARGRPNDRTAVLTFNEDLTGYDVTAGFEGNPYLGNRRLE